MAYQSEIEFRVKVLDKELRELEKRLEKLQNPFAASGKRRPTAARAAAVRAQKEEADLIRQSIEDLDRLRETKAQKRQQTMVRRVRYEREQRIKAARDVAKAEATIQRENERFREDLALGAGFPLLFGGGLGSVTGGVLGAASGGGKGGFGAQILFSAIGQQIDQFFTEVREAADLVANSIGGTTDSLEALQEAGIVVQGSLVEYVRSLEDSGQAVAAYNLVQKELTDIYGNEGVNSLRLLKDANETANEASSNLSVALQKELAPAFTKLTNLGAKLADGFAAIVPVLGLLLNPLKEIPSQRGLDIIRQQQQQERIDTGVKERASDISATERLTPIEDATSSLERQTRILELGNKLTNDRVVLLKEEDLIAEAAAAKAALQVEAFKNIGNKRELAIIQAKEQKIQAQLTLDLARLQLSVDQARTSEAEKLASQAKSQARATERAAKKAEKARAKELQDRINIAAREREKELNLEASFQKRITAIANETALLRGQINGNEELVKKQIEINTLVERFGEEKRGQIELFVNEKFQVVEQNRLLNEQKQIFGQIGETLQTGVVSLIEAAVDRTKSLGEVASGVLRNIARQLLSLGVNQLFGAFNFGGGSGGGGLNIAGIDAYMANGGSARAGGSYIVGERGPELFVPRTSGTVVPNSSLGGSANVTVNVDASGSSVEGNGNEAAQLGKAIGLAVQQELIKQKRPGGLLTR
ncbi:phage tail tape measure protein [uncultured Mediterranean phage uvMED]|nr:phage tail tape measure protein [uncultured Mediterranean phage uvMED]